MSKIGDRDRFRSALGRRSRKRLPVGGRYRAAKMACLAFAAFATGSGVAIARQPVATDAELAAAAAKRFPQPVLVGSLIGRTVLQPLESQPVLGHVLALVRAGSGPTMVIVNYGGLLGRFGGLFGIGARPIEVPIDAMTLLGPYMEVVGFTPKQLDAFPTYHGSNAVPLSPHDVIQVGLSKPSH